MKAHASHWLKHPERIALYRARIVLGNAARFGTYSQWLVLRAKVHILENRFGLRYHGIVGARANQFHKEAA